MFFGIDSFKRLSKGDKIIEFTIKKSIMKAKILWWIFAIIDKLKVREYIKVSLFLECLRRTFTAVG